MVGKLVRNFISKQIGVIIREDKSTVTIMIPGAAGDQYTTEYEKDRINTGWCPWDYITDFIVEK